MSNQGRWGYPPALWAPVVVGIRWNLESREACWVGAASLAVAFRGATQGEREGGLTVSFLPITQLFTSTSHKQVTKDAEAHALCDSEQTRGRWRSSLRANGLRLAQMCISLRVCYIAKCFPENIYQCTLTIINEGLFRNTFASIKYFNLINDIFP